MKRRVFISLLLLSLLLASCRQTAQPPAQSELVATPSEVGKIAFTDALGQEFTIDPPERAAVMIGSFADVWALANECNPYC